MRNFLILALVAGCAPTGDPKDTGVPSQDDTDDTDTDDTDTDDTDTDDTDTQEAVLEAVSLAVSATEITTRDVLTVTVTASYDDESTADVTADATFSSSDEAVLKFYAAGTGQPLWAGTASVGASYGGFDAEAVDVTVTVAAAQAGDLVFNEVLADATVDGDPNADGEVSDWQDEFVEIANYADVTVDLSGAMLVETDLPYVPRHTFAEGTILRAGEAVVVFGGGDTSNVVADHCTAVVVDNEDPGYQYGLSLHNDGERMSLVAPDETTELASIAYGNEGDVETAADASMVLDPDVWGTEYTSHHYADGAVADFSTCTLIDGSAFPGPDGRYGP